MRFVIAQNATLHYFVLCYAQKVTHKLLRRFHQVTADKIDAASSMQPTETPFRDRERVLSARCTTVTATVCQHKKKNPGSTHSI